MSKSVVDGGRSFPASPADLSSPTETEFGGHTPIDASFGERLDGGPPDRPLPDRPSIRVGQSNRRRSRSGTLTQGETALRAGQEQMQRYDVQVEDDGYDSEGEADDEYDHGNGEMLSPNEAEHYEDDQSDHPSESEDEHLSPTKAETPTTQGWADREGRSPTGLITQWSEEQVADYVAALGPSMKQYGNVFVDELVNGEALVALRHEELVELGVHSAGHRLTILKAVYEAKVRAGIKIEEGDYVPLSVESDKMDALATQDDIARIIEIVKMRDHRDNATKSELRQLKHDIDRLSEENRKLREETLPIMRLFKDQRTPLPNPSGAALPSPREVAAVKQEESKGSSLSRKFSTKKLFLGSAPKQPSPTYPPPPTSQPREVRDDGGAHLEASAAAVAASSHLTASMTSQVSPSSVHNTQFSPTSPYVAQASYPTQRSFQREGTSSSRMHGYSEDQGTNSTTASGWSQASTVVADAPTNVRSDRRRGQPSPRDEGDVQSMRERDRLVSFTTRTTATNRRHDDKCIVS